MGRIAYILKKKKINIPPLNNRFTVELCENVHIHYRNLRLEFSKEEFLHILSLLQNIDINRVKNFECSDYAYEELVKDFNLPDETYYNKRLQIEQQIEGHYHLHYRNLRLEFNSLKELGFGKYFGFRKKIQSIIKRYWKRIKFGLIRKIYKPKSTEKLISDKRITIDKNYIDNHLKHWKIYKYSLKNIKLKNLRCTLFVKEGTHDYKIHQVPAYKYLEGDKQSYIDYINYKNPIGGGDIHTVDRYEALINSFNSKGFCEDNVIIVDANNTIIDGQHRACLLLKKYGGNKKIKVLKIYKA